MENTINKNIEELSKNKNLGTEKYVEAIKDILTSHWEDVLLTDEQIQAIIDGEEWDWLDNYEKKDQYANIYIIANCLKNLNREKMKDFIKRKNEYLEKNRTISKEKFEELFWWSGKLWKAEINQWPRNFCYMDTWLELFKKMNWFNEIIQTHLKEVGEWWEVKLPFFDTNWEWIKVSKDEIDKEFTMGSWNKKSINSYSSFTGFKILEIAFIKNYIIHGYRNWILRLPFDKERQEFKSTGNININNNTLYEFNSISGNLNKFLFPMLNEECYVERSGFDESCWLHAKMQDLAFNYHTKWLYMIELSHAENKIIKNVKIIYKKKDQLLWPEYSDIKKDENWKSIVCFSPMHSYSIEKCYIDKNTWEKRVRVVNPRHTWIKYDISLEDCKSIFKRNVVWIDIDKMFR